MSRAAKLEAGGALLVYVVLLGVWWALGGTFFFPPDLWQFLPWPVLANDLAGSLLDLHAQPPLPNLVLGLAVKAALATGVPIEIWLAPVQVTLGATAVVCVTRVAHRLVSLRWLRWTAVAVFLANPYLYATSLLFFYTIWEVAFLAMLVFMALRFLESPTPTRLAATLAPALLLTLTRAAWHPLWVALVSGVLVLAAGRAGNRRRMAGVAVAAVLLSLAWPAKNLARFGFFGSSSWQGFNFWRGLPLEHPVALDAFLRMADDRPTVEALEAAAALVPAEWAGRPAVSMLVKPPPGLAPNWNHYAMIPVSRSLGASSVDAVLRDPLLLAYRAADYYVNGYCIFEARDPYTSRFELALRAGGEPWALAYEKVVMLAFRPYDPHQTRITTGFALLFPIAMSACAAGLVRRRGQFGAAEWTLTIMGLCVVWTLALVLLVDGAEGNRMRFCTQPMILLLTAWTVERTLARARRAGDGSALNRS